MKYFVVITLALLCLTGCADSKDFEVINEEGQEVLMTVEPYGWFNTDTKVEGIKYSVCWQNIFLDVVFSETLIIPIYLTGSQFYEPVGFENKPITYKRNLHDKPY